MAEKNDKRISASPGSTRWPDALSGFSLTNSVSMGRSPDGTVTMSVRDERIGRSYELTSETELMGLWEQHKVKADTGHVSIFG